MKKRTTWMLWGAVAFAIIGFTGCPNNGNGNGEPEVQFHTIRITGIPFVDGETPTDVAFLQLMNVGDTGAEGFALLQGNLFGVSAIVPDGNGTTATATLNPLFDGNLLVFIMAFNAAQAEQAEAMAGGAPFDSSGLPALPPEISPRVSGSGIVSAMYVTIGAQMAHAEAVAEAILAGTTPPLAPATSSKQWPNVSFNDSVADGILTLAW